MRKPEGVQVLIPLMLAVIIAGIFATPIKQFLVPSSASATSWTQQFSDNFNRSDSATAGNGWLDAAGIGSISSDRLALAATGGTPIANQLLRPSSENTVDQRTTFVFAANNGANAQEYAIFRVQSGDTETEYLAGYNGNILLASLDHGSINVIGSQMAPSSFDSTHSYTIDASVVGTSPTTLSVTMTDNTTNTVVGSETQTDSTADLQVSGQSGLAVNDNSPPATIYTTNFTSYNDNPVTSPATSYTLSGPSSGNINAVSSNYTVTPNGVYTGTITPSDNGGGGTFTPSSLNFSNSSAAKTFTYMPASTGTKTISTTSSPGLTNPSSLSYTAHDPAAGVVSVTNSNLNWSPYNWHFNGSTWAETQPGGGYVKLAFTGSTLGLNIDTSAMQVDASQTLVDAYIDGSNTPIQMNLGQVNNGLLTFSNALSSGNHYATIYLSFDPCGCGQRWLQGQTALRIDSIQLANDGSGSILPLSSSQVAKKSTKVLMYGDSITEGYNTSGSEYEYSALLGKSLGVEYGQDGYRSGGWNIGVDTNGVGTGTTFYNIGDTANSWYAGYDNAKSRFNTPNIPSSGFVDSTPDAVFNNLGVNDYYDSSGASTMQTKITDWLVDMRSALGSRPAIFMIVPFDFGNTGNTAEQAYKTAWLAGVSDYETAHPSDTRVFVIDLGANGYNIVQNNSNDSAPKVHPNDAGAALLAAAIEPQVAPYISTVLQAGSISQAATPSSSTVSLATTAPTGGIAPYSYQWYRSTTANFTPDSTSLISGATSDTLSNSGLNASTTYYYKVVYGDSTDPDQSVTSAQFTVTTAANNSTTNSGNANSSTAATQGATLTKMITATSSSKPIGYSGTGTPTSESSSAPTVIGVSNVDSNGYDSSGNMTTTAHPTITGTAPPYAQVTLTFHSTPTYCETNADANGNWSCTLGQALPAGTHTVDIAAVTTDGQTLTFPEFHINVLGDATTTKVKTVSNAAAKTVHHSHTWEYVLAVIVLLGLGWITIRPGKKTKA